MEPFPEPTGRLSDGEVTLRRWTMADAMALERACGDPDICRVTTVPWRYAPADAIDWIQRQELRRKEGSALALAITRAGDDRSVGTVSLSDPDWADRRASLGCWLIAAERGKGLGKRATALMSDWALGELGLDRLELEIEPGNESSSALARSLGAEPTGQRRTRERHGEAHELDLWALRR